MNDCSVVLECARMVAGYCWPSLSGKRRRKTCDRIDRAAARVGAAALVTRRARALLVRGPRRPGGRQAILVAADRRGRVACWPGLFVPEAGGGPATALAAEQCLRHSGSLFARAAPRLAKDISRGAVAAAVAVAARAGALWARATLPADPRARAMLAGHFRRGEREASRLVLADYLEERGDGRAAAVRALAARRGNPAPALAACVTVARGDTR